MSCRPAIACVVLGAALAALPVRAAGLTVPLDISAGPAGFWFFGPLVANRGGVPHFALMFDVYAVLDQKLIQDNLDKVPASYRGMARGLREVKIGPSLFIPSTLIISPKIQELGNVGMYGVSWTPLGLTLVNVGQSATSTWKEAPGRLTIDAKLLLTYLFIHSDAPQVPPFTHFLRPGLQLTLTFLIHLSERVLLSFGGGGQLYVPQKLGEFGFGPLDESIFVTAFTFLKLHGRVPYDVKL